MKTKNGIKKLLLSITILFCAGIAAKAQGPGFDPDVADTPFDGGVTLVAVAAAGYGLKKLRDAKKEK